jgi:prepilin-type processing-associated H-X9-DG protein/prepilin-type N-terminal cleavage/methylation domain-containing protein
MQQVKVRERGCVAADRGRESGFGRRAFTMVEILVVIGIIAVLMGILLPVLSKARQQANTVRCATNLREMGNAFQMYASAHAGRIVPGRMPRYNGPDSTYDMGLGLHYRPRWYELLGAQIKRYPTKNMKQSEDDNWTISDPFFLCMARPDWVNSRNYTYGYNYQFLGNDRYKPSGAHINYPVKTTKIKAAETVMAADSMGTAAGRPTGQRHGYYPDGTKDIYAWGNKGWCLDPPRLTNNSDYADPQNRAPENRSGPDPRHSKKSNVVFCDGHVELMAPQDMGYIVRPDGSMAALDPKASNRLFSGSGRNDDPPPIQ